MVRTVWYRKIDNVLEISLNAHRMVGHSVLQAMRQLVRSHGYGVRGQETRPVSISLSRNTKPVDYMHNSFATTG